MRAYRLLAEHAEPGVYNVCSGRTASTTELIAALAAAAGVRSSTRSTRRCCAPHEVMELRGSYERAAAATGWEPEIPLEQTLSGRARVVASLASTGAELLRDDARTVDLGARERLRVQAVDLDQRALTAADTDRDHQHGAVAEALELGDLGGIALRVADDDLARQCSSISRAVAG